MQKSLIQCCLSSYHIYCCSLCVVTLLQQIAISLSLPCQVFRFSADSARREASAQRSFSYILVRFIFLFSCLNLMFRIIFRSGFTTLPHDDIIIGRIRWCDYVLCILITLIL